MESRIRFVLVHTEQFLDERLSLCHRKLRLARFVRIALD